jgi:PPOX class probable FMN-dependent enzyme
MSAFEHIVSSLDELRAIVEAPAPGARTLLKERTTVDAHCRAFIARSPLLVIATADAHGRCDVSPKGDAPGFVHVLDERRLAIPDRPGNRRLDGMQNLLSNPHVGLIFLVPGREETLRVNGRAWITRDPDILRRAACRARCWPLASKSSSASSTARRRSCARALGARTGLPGQPAVVRARCSIRSSPQAPRWRLRTGHRRRQLHAAVLTPSVWGIMASMRGCRSVQVDLTVAGDASTSRFSGGNASCEAVFQHAPFKLGAKSRSSALRVGPVVASTQQWRRNNAIASLKGVAIPQRPDLARYVADPQSLVVLGKALFWDAQVGSDGRTACATCHFHAGADHRITNQIAGPAASTTAVRPNTTLTIADFPFHAFTNPNDNASAAPS